MADVATEAVCKRIAPSSTRRIKGITPRLARPPRVCACDSRACSGPCRRCSGRDVCFASARAAGRPRAGRKCSTKQNPPRALPGLPRQAGEASARGGYGGEAGRLINPADGCYPSLMTFAFFSFNILSFCFAYSSTETPRRFGMFAFALAQPDTACAWLIVAAHGVAGLAATDRRGHMMRIHVRAPVRVQRQSDCRHHRSQVTTRSLRAIPPLLTKPSWRGKLCTCKLDHNVNRILSNKLSNTSQSIMRKRKNDRDVNTAGICDPRNRVRRQVCTAATLSRRCPLWVKSRHQRMSAGCPLYPRKRTPLHSITIDFVYGSRTSFCARQFNSSPTQSTFSDGQAIS